MSGMGGGIGTRMQTELCLAELARDGEEVVKRSSWLVGRGVAVGLNKRGDEGVLLARWWNAWPTLPEP